VGVVTKTVKVVTCDLCGNRCGENDNQIDFAINGGDGRDVGPTRIQGRITLNAPYAVSDGLLCNNCLRRCLKRFIGIKEQTTNEL
jgi:hypothetical protein